MKIAIITGEESGDKLAASAIKELKLQYKESIYLFGIGGNALKKQGIDNLFDISEIKVDSLNLPSTLKSSSNSDTLTDSEPSLEASSSDSF